MRPTELWENDILVLTSENESLDEDDGIPVDPSRSCLCLGGCPAGLSSRNFKKRRSSHLLTLLRCRWRSRGAPENVPVRPAPRPPACLIKRYQTSISTPPHACRGQSTRFIRQPPAQARTFPVSPSQRDSHSTCDIITGNLFLSLRRKQGQEVYVRMRAM